MVLPLYSLGVPTVEGMSVTMVNTYPAMSLGSVPTVLLPVQAVITAGSRVDLIAVEEWSLDCYCMVKDRVHLCACAHNVCVCVCVCVCVVCVECVCVCVYVCV